MKIENSLTDPISLEKGVRQGCPVSPIFYILYLEPLRLKLHSLTQASTSLWLPQSVPKVLAHADDLAILTILRDVPRLLSKLRRLEKRTGLRINERKSKALHNSHPNPSLPPTYHIPLEDMTHSTHKYLGAQVGGQHPDSHTHDIASARLSTLLSNIAYSYSLPLVSRAQLIQSVASGVLQYYMQLAHFTPRQIDKIQTKTIHTFWAIPNTAHKNTRKQHIARARIILPRKRGGMGIANFLIWQQALYLNLLIKLGSGAPNPDHPTNITPDTTWIRLLLHLIYTHAVKLNILREPRTFLWWPLHDGLAVTSKLPPFWKAIFTFHFEHCRPPTISLSASTRLDLLFYAQLSQSAAGNHELYANFVPSVDPEDQPPNCPLPLPQAWQDTIQHPAYLLPFPYPDPPSKPGSITRHYYQQLTDKHLANDVHSPSTPIVDWAPLLRRRITNGPDDRLLRKTILSMYTSPIHSDALKTHAWLLWQHRLLPAYSRCPWCGEPPAPQTPLSQRSSVRFQHIAWSCPSFRPIWVHFASPLDITAFSSILPIALGLQPAGALIPVDMRRRALALHASIFTHRHLFHPDQQLSVSDIANRSQQVLAHYHLLLIPKTPN